MVLIGLRRRFGAARRARYEAELGLPAADARVLTEHPRLADAVGAKVTKAAAQLAVGRDDAHLLHISDQEGPDGARGGPLLAVGAGGFLGAVARYLVALGFARKFDTVGFDIHVEKVEELKRGYDRNHEVPESVLKETKLKMTADVAALKGCTFFVVAVPTPVDHNNVPDLTPVIKASEIHKWRKS